MATQSPTAKKRFGSAILLSLLTLIGAGLMYLHAGDPVAGWGFALAMGAGALAVTVLHL